MLTGRMEKIVLRTIRTCSNSGMWSRLNQFEPQKFDTTRHMWYWCDEWVDGNEARNCLDWTILNAPVSLNHLHFAVGLQCMWTANSAKGVMDLCSKLRELEDFFYGCRNECDQKCVIDNHEAFVSELSQWICKLRILKIHMDWAQRWRKYAKIITKDPSNAVKVNWKMPTRTCQSPPEPWQFCFWVLLLAGWDLAGSTGNPHWTWLRLLPFRTTRTRRLGFLLYTTCDARRSSEREQLGTESYFVVGCFFGRFEDIDNLWPL